MVEMDVGEDDVAEVADRRPTGRKRLLEGAEAGCRSAVDECRLVARSEVSSNDLRMSEVEKVERLEVAT
jgi:hypothetical protein